MAFAALPNFNSDSDPDISDTAENTDAKPSRGLLLTYNYDKTFENQGEAVKFVKGEKQFRFRNTLQSSNANRSYYNCKVHRSCPVHIYLQLDPTSQNVSF